MASAPKDAVAITPARAKHIAAVIEGLLDGAIDDLATYPGIGARDRLVSALGDVIERAQDIVAVRLNQLGCVPTHARFEVGRIAAFYAGRAIADEPAAIRRQLSPRLVTTLGEGTISPCLCADCRKRRGEA